MTVYSESNYLSDWLKYELDGYQSRELVTVKSGESVVMAEVVGKINKSTPTTGTAGAGNTGNGTCASVTAGADAIVGTYTLECTAAADASTGTGAIFKIVNPEGNALPDAEAGVLYTNDQLNLTLTDGVTPFIVGDSFTIAVTEPGTIYTVPIDFSAVDGSQNAAGIMIAACDASAAAKDGVIVARDAQIVAAYLTWPDGASTAQKNAALAQLKTLGIIQKTEA